MKKNICQKCNGPIEYVEEGKNKYWRHSDMRDLDIPHAAKPKF